MKQIIKKFKFTLISLILILILFIYNELSIKTNKRLNLIVICANCLNKNRLGIYGNSPTPTPNIDKLSQNSFIFNNFFCSSTHTNPSIYELLTSKRSLTQFPNWNEIRSKLYFSKLKNYNFYLPDKLFGRTWFKNKSYKEPFIVFDHPKDLHDPYNTKLELKNNIITDNYTKRILDIERNKEASYFPFYRDIVGYPFKIYKKDITNWKIFVDIIKSNNNSLQYKILKKYIDKETILKLIEIDDINLITYKIKFKLLNALNKFILSNELFNNITFIEHKLKIDNVIISDNNKLFKNILINFYELKEDKFLEIKNDHIKTINRNKMTNCDEFYFRRFKLYIIGYLFSQTEKNIWKKINNSKNIYKKSNDSLVKNEKSISSDKNILRSFYDENLKKFDNRIGNILKWLKENKHDKDTILVILGDHGEALLEHKGVLGHASDKMYNEIVNPPLIIKLPDQKEKIIIKDIIDEKDIFPILTDIIEFKNNKNIYEISFKKLLKNKKYIDRKYIFIKGINNGYAIVSKNKWKLIYNSQTEKKELYDLNSDKKELKDISLENPRITAELYEKLLDLILK